MFFAMPCEVQGVGGIVERGVCSRFMLMLPGMVDSL